MILSMPGQAWLFLATVGVGASIGLFYDAFRVLRRTVPHRRWVVQLEDLFFWLAVTVLVFYYMLHRNSGEIRIFSVLGMAIGAALYFATLSRPLLKIAVVIVEFLQRVIAAILRILLLPLRLLLALLTPPARVLHKKILHRLRTVKQYGKMKLRRAGRARTIIRKKV